MLDAPLYERIRFVLAKEVANKIILETDFIADESSFEMEIQSVLEDKYSLYFSGHESADIAALAGSETHSFSEWYDDTLNLGHIIDSMTYGSVFEDLRYYLEDNRANIVTAIEIHNQLEDMAKTAPPTDIVNWFHAWLHSDGESSELTHVDFNESHVRRLTALPALSSPTDAKQSEKLLTELNDWLAYYNYHQLY